MDPPLCTSTYEAGLQEAATLLQQSVKLSTVKVCITVARELMDWLQRMHRSMAIAIPGDCWLPNHAGSSSLSGNIIAAPTSLAGVKPHLAKQFDLQGRIGDVAAQLGNPMHSMQIKDMIKGYHNQAAELGYQKRGAVALEEAEMVQVLERMCSNLTSAPLQEQLLLMGSSKQHCCFVDFKTAFDININLGTVLYCTVLYCTVLYCGRQKSVSKTSPCLAEQFVCDDSSI